MYFAASLFVASAITLFLVSKIAKMLNAKRPGIEWVLLSLVISGALAATTLVLIGIFIQELDPNIILGITLITVFIVSSAAYKYLNQLPWSGAFTLNIASVSIGLLTVIAAIVLNGESIKESLEFVNITAKNNTLVASDNQKHNSTSSQESANSKKINHLMKKLPLQNLIYYPLKLLKILKVKKKEYIKNQNFV